MPRRGSRVHAIGRFSFRLTARPRRSGGVPAAPARSYASWAAPGPWQASHPTPSSTQVVSYRSRAASQFLRTPVEWHSAHIEFQTW